MNEFTLLLLQCQFLVQSLVVECKKKNTETLKAILRFGCSRNHCTYLVEPTENSYVRRRKIEAYIVITLYRLNRTTERCADLSDFLLKCMPGILDSLIR